MLNSSLQSFISFFDLNLLGSLGKFIVLFLSSFIFWRKLKEDYKEEEILSLTLMLIVFGFLGYKIYFLTGAFLATILSAAFLTRFKKINWWPVADALVFPLLITGLGMTLAGLIFHFSWELVFQTSLFFLIMIVGLRISKTYRSVSWYQSGKIGFLFYFTIMAFFSAFLVLEIVTQKKLYWQMLVELGIILVSFVLLYQRAERDWQEDKKSLLNKFKKKKKDHD